MRSECGCYVCYQARKYLPDGFVQSPTGESVVRRLSETVFVCWKSILPNLFDKTGSAFSDSRAGLRISTAVSKSAFREETEKVVEYLHLSITVRTGSDADRRNGDTFRYSTCQAGGNQFQYDSEDAG